METERRKEHRGKKEDGRCPGETKPENTQNGWGGEYPKPETFHGLYQSGDKGEGMDQYSLKDILFDGQEKGKGKGGVSTL